LTTLAQAVASDDLRLIGVMFGRVCIYKFMHHAVLCGPCMAWWVSGAWYDGALPRRFIDRPAWCVHIRDWTVLSVAMRVTGGGSTRICAVWINNKYEAAEYAGCAGTTESDD
jgi:hypothetical protein